MVYVGRKTINLWKPENISGEQKDFFTIKRSWAFNTWTEDDGGVDRWPWIAEWPQVPGKNKSGEIEQVAVSAGFHASTSRGRSFVQESRYQMERRTLDILLKRRNTVLLSRNSGKEPLSLIQKS